ncbi:hypothetical protein VHEMI02080 [[Torrubiella] hemipterigena]|uniref:GH16 domain-containing protein n=1 Tax=[Torrubiella] hemipterigena TaxID=1531966 RepID=A0A0A1SUS6_9HYPO|nr:hypothetical protein VHEMI02080 [[Torrubiella] hemipterigena]
MRLTPTSAILVASGLLPVHVTAQDTSGGAAPAKPCECFVTNGTAPEFFSNHLFFDYRNLTQFAGVPPAVSNEDAVSDAPITSDFFASEEWTKHWGTQTWDNSKGKSQGFSNDATVHMINSANNLFIQANEDSNADSATYLTMRTKRFKDFQTAAEFEAIHYDYKFLSLRMLARTVGSAGAVAGMFTYKNSSDPAKVQEADIEILTRDPGNVIQYTNQPSDLPDVGTIPEATRNVTLPDGVKWSDWAVHRVDWTPERSVWYINGHDVASIAFQVPRDASGINFNMWSDGGSWSGNMSVGAEASLQIKWIEMVYNSTTPIPARKMARSELQHPRASLIHRSTKGKTCQVVCSIDNGTQPGVSVVLFTSSQSSGARFSSFGTYWLSIYMAAVALLLPAMLISS